MAMINTEFYCGFCGTECTDNVNVDYKHSYIELTIQCPKCSKRIIALEEQNEELADTIAEIKG
jgi:DNA-directed RNA polymerase subunit RPC12/RpoP